MSSLFVGVFVSGVCLPLPVTTGFVLVTFWFLIFLTKSGSCECWVSSSVLFNIIFAVLFGLIITDCVFRALLVLTCDC